MTLGAREPTGARLFSFVVVADTHVNERETRSMSPFETNARANGRARYVLEEIAGLDPAPAFVVHLGDIVHPMPGVPAYAEAAQQFKAMAARLAVPLHLVPGNHDVGDKSVDWMPAEIVCDDYVALYRRTFGADYYAFDAGSPGQPVRAIVIDAQLLNSGLADEAAQRSWLEAELAAHPRARRFLFTHYPPYVFAVDERGSYDNIDLPARAWLLDLLCAHRVEALFAGHVHNFWYDVHADTELYLLPSTAFLRHDYSEFYRVDPGNEFGRGDAGKFGYGIVDVYEHGHALRLVRTDGRSLGPDAPPVPRRVVPARNVKTAVETGVGVELRHPWAEITEIASTGGVQEFGRKLARNDYPLMALWEMGARLAKIPEQDVLNPVTRARMRLMRDIGHRFIVTALGAPREALVEALRESPDLVDAIEFNLGTKALAAAAPQLTQARAALGVPLYWAKLRMHEDQPHVAGGQINHFIKTGLMPPELATVAAVLEAAGVRDAVDGVVVRIERDVAVLKEAPGLAAFTESTGLAVLASIKLADASLATNRDDDVDTARLVAEALLAARLSSRVTWVFDTLMDVDRGYFPRHGFIDRMFNPRPALRAYAAMAGVLAGAGAVTIENEERGRGFCRVRFKVGPLSGALVCGEAGCAALDVDAVGVSGECIDLCTGEIDSPAAPATRAHHSEKRTCLWVVIDDQRLQ